MTIDSTAFSPTRPPPWYQRSFCHEPSSAVSTPDSTLATARSSRAIPWSVGAGNIRSAY